MGIKLEDLKSIIGEERLRPFIKQLVVKDRGPFINEVDVLSLKGLIENIDMKTFEELLKIDNRANEMQKICLDSRRSWQKAITKDKRAIIIEKMEAFKLVCDEWIEKLDLEEVSEILSADDSHNVDETAVTQSEEKIEDYINVIQEKEAI